MSELVKLEFALTRGGMNAEDIRDKLAGFGSDDPEAAHGWEDDFTRSVLRAIAQGHPNPARLAEEALVVLGAEYSRWFA